MSRKNKGNDEASENTMAWMLTFSDLIMLLLTFFVLLLTMSSMDKKKLKDLFTNFTGSTGVLEFAGYGEVKNLADLVRKYRSTDGMLVINQELLRDIILPAEEKEKLEKEMGGKLKVDISDDTRGIVLSFHEDLLFDPGQETPRAIVLPVLRRIAVAIKSTPNQILIMGHTDNRPVVGGRYASNWELSAYRGLAVLNYFLKVEKISSSRFSVGGYGPVRPAASNNTPAGRAANRRVEIIFRHM